MRKLIFLILLFVSIKSFSQEIQLYRKHVDSVLIKRSHSKRKIIAVKVDKTNVYFSFDKKTKELLSISYTADLDTATSISSKYIYEFIGGKFAILRKFNDQLAEVFRSIGRAQYYFQNDILVAVEEINTKIENIDTQLELLRHFIIIIPKY